MNTHAKLVLIIVEIGVIMTLSVRKVLCMIYHEMLLMVNVVSDILSISIRELMINIIGLVKKVVSRTLVDMIDIRVQKLMHIILFMFDQGIG